ncbi:hypothetical protein [Nocardia cerradoensis]|uniref:Uncharacterized protein n=1 Tax=Nocardia cerradoensis TaxID=85688 RepID=A0A231GV38_9NOCA|nr:hypothetical protein [Nocardia cerradoensis]NKY43629.1 hypothetical protein [Nocardia cerradoensis]OXR40442.1 hypothetical protein B7C42_07500 [Nocardia cerradoensis]
MKLRIGTRLRSQVCTAEIVVVVAPDLDVDLQCGGYPMVDIAAPAAADGAPTTAGHPGALLGKRYMCDSVPVEVLVTKAGAGALFVGAEPMRPKSTTPLPSTD